MKDKPMNGTTRQKTKNTQIVEFLRTGIQTGKYKPGQRIPSETVLCKRFSATRATVGKALQDLVHMKLITRRRGSGSFVNLSDQSRTLTFGLLVPGLGEGEIFEPICNAIATTVSAHNHQLIWGQFSTLNADERCTQAERLCQSYIEQKVDGVFFAPTELVDSMQEANTRIARMLSREGIPVILLDRDIARFPNRSPFDLVGIDNRRAGYILASHFLDRGCQRIVFVARVNSAQTVDARITGYREALLDRHMPSHAGRVFLGEPDDPAFIDKLLRNNRPDAVICANDYTAAKLICALLKRGIKVPRDIRVAGMDDLKYASLLTVPLTTIQQPCIKLGQVAAHAMFERITHPDLPSRDLLLDFKLVTRHSSGDDLHATRTGKRSSRTKR